MAPATSWFLSSRSATPRTDRPPGERQRAFDAALRRRMHGLTIDRSASAGPSLSVGAPPGLGSLRDFHVLATVDSAHQTFRRVTAQLGFVGANVLVYLDTLAPAGGFSAGQLTAFG